MTVDTIRDLSDRLDRHRKAFYEKGGFESFSERKLLFYLGYGRELVLPDGRPYETYLKGGESGLKITFIGPRLGTSSVKTQLGYAQFTPQDGGLRLRGATSGRETGRADLHTHDFPSVTELVKPFGGWAADGLTQEINHEKTNARIRHQVGQGFRELENSILMAERIDELTLIERSTAKLAKIIRNARQLKEPRAVVPSAEDAALLEEFISDPGNTTAGWTPINEPEAVGLQVINVQGPLLA
jgi:hypothetical protein